MFNSQLQKSQIKKVKRIKKNIKYILEIGFDNSNGNGCNDFYTIIDVYENGRFVQCGSDLKLICEIFPEYAYLTKWHNGDSEQPSLHYIENSVYFWKNKNYNAFKDSAKWPEVTNEFLDNTNETELRLKLKERLPELMTAFKKDVESIGFTW